MATAEAPTRRERQRAATVAEIDATARALLDREGPAGVTVAAVAREMDMTAPALYRYVDGYEGLLTRLITAGYVEVAERLEAAGHDAPDTDPSARLVAIGLAWRTWALEQRSMFGLLYGSPLPGYAAPEDGPTTLAARRVGAAFLQVIAEAWEGGRLDEPPLGATEAADVGAEPASTPGWPDLPAPLVQASSAGFALLVGAMTMEVFGHGPPHDDAQAEAAYLYKIRAALLLVGAPPRSGAPAAARG